MHGESTCLIGKTLRRIQESQIVVAHGFPRSRARIFRRVVWLGKDVTMVPWRKVRERQRSGNEGGSGERERFWRFLNQQVPFYFDPVIYTIFKRFIAGFRRIVDGTGFYCILDFFLSWIWLSARVPPGATETRADKWLESSQFWPILHCKISIRHQLVTL